MNDDDWLRNGPTPFSSSRLADRGIDELIGACRGVLADGFVNDGEARFLLDWLNANRETATKWPADRLYLRVRAMLVDQTLDVEEQGELLELLHGIVGGPVGVEERISSYSTTLPLCSPQPELEFMNKTYVLTGTFASGTRKECEAAVVERGGLVCSALSQETSYLVIGAMGTVSWMHSTFGRKIERAMEMKAEGHSIGIVSEQHWVNALGRFPPR